MQGTELQAVLAAASYLMGSVPLGLLLARAKGVDIRSVGSGNIGATNVFRCVSRALGIATFAGDALKGFVPAFVFPRLAESAPSTGFALLCGCAAIAGHNWPVFLKFRGGKGVATSAGVLLGVAPLAVAVGAAAWAVLLVVTRYVAVASMGAAAAIAAFGWFRYAAAGPLLPVVLTALAAVVVLRHHGNIRRLLRGTEHRFARGRSTR